jgi:hypothetical protein
MKLRLLLHSQCNRSCEGCCNKDWDLKNLPIVTSYKGYEKILITGGEPLLTPSLLFLTIESIQEENPSAKIYLYTANVARADLIFAFLAILDGVTVTLHEQQDVFDFVKLNDLLLGQGIINKSLRLNVFKGINISYGNLSLWKVKNDIEWIKDCPLPRDEVFMRLPK